MSRWAFFHNGALGRLLIILLAAVLVYWALSPLSLRLRQQSELASLRREKHRLATENSGLRDEIKRLRNDTDHIEWLARKSLGLIKPDEEAYVVIETSPAAVKTKPKSQPDIWQRIKDGVSRTLRRD